MTDKRIVARLKSLMAGALIVFLATACSGSGSPIEPDRFVAVLVDLHLTESRREIVGDMPPATRDSILESHDVSETQYERSVRYYTERPEEYLQLYNAVIDSLSAELGELEESGEVELIER
ncbi:MAG: DUF4296 domain-containing protein [Rhodothermia bacterium]|nr:DUF4296 domain-containing protein [Rhodothermia bacterium]